MRAGLLNSTSAVNGGLEQNVDAWAKVSTVILVSQSHTCPPVSSPGWCRSPANPLPCLCAQVLDTTPAPEI